MRPWIMLSALVVIWMFSVAFSGISHPLDNPLRGPAFTDPESGFTMDQTWRKRPILYSEEHKDSDLTVSLDQHLYPALLPIIQNFADKQGLKIFVHEGTCGISGGLLMDKSVDITGYCCPAGQSDRLPDVEFHTLGIAPLRIIVHPTNPIDKLNMDQVRDIFQGKIFSWDSLTKATTNFRADSTIRPITRLHCKTRPGHWRLLLDNPDLFSPMVLEVGTIRDMISQVHSNPYAIGFAVQYHIQKFTPDFAVKSITINGFDPANADNLVSLNYPLYRSMNITTWKGSLEKKTAQQVLDVIETSVATLEQKYEIIPAEKLRKAGWKFKGNELIGEPR